MGVILYSGKNCVCVCVLVTIIPQINSDQGNTACVKNGILLHKDAADQLRKFLCLFSLCGSRQIWNPQHFPLMHVSYL